MTFALICIGALLVLGGVAALFSGKEDTPIQHGRDCTSCANCDEEACNLKSIMKESTKRKAQHTPLLMLAALAVLLSTAACSTEKNTAKTRRWHAFTTRYNVYYNGNQAYIDGSLEKEKGNKDNFTELIPLYTVGNKGSRELGKTNFNRAIEKAQKAIKLHSIHRRPEWNKSRRKTERDIEWLSRREYNPFLWKAWMLMGRSQFHQGNFDEAASTFSYMARLYHTQPAIYGKARAWLAKCYIEQDWLYDAEDVINKMQRDSMDWRARKEWDYAYADYYIHTKQYAEAVPFMQRVIKHEMRRKQKAREWYLLGQLYAALGQRDDAYKAFRHVVRMNPPYELDFNARIAMTEVMAGGNPKKMVNKLKRMARSEKNTAYLDQIYYAMGNIYLAQRDTLQAISAYEKGNEEGTRNGIEKGVLLLKLGDLYWEREQFSDAKRCYGTAIGLLDKERSDYEQLSERSRVLDELVPYTEAVHLQDSLQALAKLPEAERNAAIDRVIEALKKKEKEERRRQAESEAQAQLAQQNATGNRAGTQTSAANAANSGTNGTWYFYNPMTVSQGKQAFQQQWGKRENVDNWQRVNRTVVAGASEEETLTEEQRDSIAQAEAAADSLQHIADSAQNDPHKREYYLKDIPFTEEQVAASNLTIMNGLHHSGVIFKDKLNNLTLGEKQLRRLTDQYPSYEQMDDVYYHLFLLYMRQGNTQMADVYLNKLKTDYPQSQWTTLLTDPYFEENARFGVHLEDSLYGATYEAFKKNRINEVKSNCRFAEKRFPMGANRDKFIFIGGLNDLNEGNSKGCLEAMKTLVEKYPESEVSPMAGMIINGVKAGRQLRGGHFDMESVWERRTYVLSDSDSISSRVFEAERNTDFMFIIAYHPDSVDENRLLFELARFNFTGFPVRNFDINIEDADGLRRMTLNGFRNYDEVLQYARALHRQETLKPLLGKTHIIIISEKNLELLGTQYSYADYDKFYEKHFVPLKISTVRLLTEPVTIEYEKREEPEDSETPENGEEKPDGDDLFNGGVIDDETLLDLGIEETEAPDTTLLPAEQPQTTEQPQPAAAENSTVVEENNAVVEESNTVIEDGNTVVEEESTVVEEPSEPAQQPDAPLEIPEEQPTIVEETPTESIDEQTTVVEEPSKEERQTNETEDETTLVEEQSTAPQTIDSTADDTIIITDEEPQTQKEDTGIDFSDGFGDVDSSSDDQQNTQKPSSIDLEDEYYDLDGF